MDLGGHWSQVLLARSCWGKGLMIFLTEIRKLWIQTEGIRACPEQGHDYLWIGPACAQLFYSLLILAQLSPPQGAIPSLIPPDGSDGCSSRNPVGVFPESLPTLVRSLKNFSGLWDWGSSREGRGRGPPNFLSIATGLLNENN